MKTWQRYAISFLLAITVEFTFFLFVKGLSLPEEETKIKGIIQISLIKEKRFLLGEESGFKKEVTKSQKLKVKSKKTLKKIPEEETKQKIKGGITSLEGNLPAFYVEQIREEISKNVFYPVEAIREKEEGIVRVRFQLLSDGKVAYCKPEQERFKFLETAACLAISKANFPPFPDSIKNRKLTFIVEIEYNLKKAF